MYKMTVYKKDKGCPNCAVLDRLIPTLQKKYPEIVSWEYVVVSADDPNTKLPDFVKSFPTSVLGRGDDNDATVIVGYENIGKKLNEVIRS